MDSAQYAVRDLSVVLDGREGRGLPVELVGLSDRIEDLLPHPHLLDVQLKTGTESLASFFSDK